MAIVEWDGSLAIGVDIIDRQHKQLLAIINSFNEKIGREDGVFALAVVLDSLKNYVHYHFSMEEKLLARSDCPDLEKHLGAHNAFTALVASYEKRMETVTSAELLMLQTFLVQWLSSHIKSEDMRLKDYFAAGYSAAQ